MTKYLLLVVVTAATTAFAIMQFFPPKEVKKIVPTIVTKYDTVDALPTWFEDSVKKWKSRLATSDKTPIVITNTVVAAAPINVIATPEQRPDLWPLLSYHGGSKWADTAIILTFSLRTGKRAISRVFVPGILTDIESDSGHNVPKLTYTPFPKPKGRSLGSGLRLLLIGAGTIFVVDRVF